MNIIFTVLSIFIVWAIILYLIKRGGKQYGLEVMGPLLAWKTEKGKKFIDNISKNKIWKHYGNISILLCIGAMILTIYLILLNVIIAFQIPPERAPSPRLILGIPGINPAIPIGYGILALAIAIIIHEFSHGILARFGKVKIKSLGLLFLIFPIGAFVEPDEEQLKKVSRLKRSRVFAAGPASNIIVAVICILLLSFVFSPLINSKTSGVILENDIGDVSKWSIITEIDGNEISNVVDFKRIENNLTAGKFYNITFFKKGYETKRIIFGAYVGNVVKGSPAEESGLKKGYVLYRISRSNGSVELKSWEDFYKALNSTKAGEKIWIAYYFNDSYSNISVILADKFSFTNDEEDKGKGFLGIGAYGIEDVIRNTEFYKNMLNPLKIEPFDSVKTKFFSFISLPFSGLSPLPDDLASLYTPPKIFWIIYNIIYWVFWLNFAIGTFNALPIMPLDGGYIFKDGVSFTIYKINRRIKDNKLEKISSTITTIVSVIIFLSLLSIIVVPRLRSIISF
ncbi:MAG: hypothetical protein FE041_04020 [Thermoplasmata archaeon]|nr:MAG: hypothetical protein FE041_04020 [Thermoplasmata archaeon]